MPSQTTKIKASSIKAYNQIIGQGNYTWKPGVISLVAEDRLPIGAVVQAQNMMQTQDGVWGTRWGSINYGAGYTGPVTGFQEFSWAGVNYYAVIDAGIFRYAQDGGAWTDVLVPAGTPAAPTATKVTGTGLGVGVYKYKVTFLSGGGETTPGTDGDVTTTSGDQKVDLSDIPVGQAGVTGRNIYRTAVGGTTYKLLTTITDNTTTTYVDTTADSSLGVDAPTVDTSTILFNTTVWTNMVQWEGKLLLCNGVDAFSYIDLSSFDWVGFVHVDAPTSLDVTLSTGLSDMDPVTTLYYQVTAVTDVGESLPSTVFPQDVNIDRNNWYNPNVTEAATSTLFATLTWDAPAGDNIIGYNLYISDGVQGVTYYMDSTNNLTYTDYGSAAVNDFIQVPVDDTTTAPSFSWLAISDNRLWGTGDPNNLSRLYWAGTGPQYNTAFSPYAGGGWVDILPGAPQLPKFVGQFRDGQGTPMTTILLEEPSGYGSTWHCSLSTDTIGNTVIAVPTLIQSMGTFGTGAPRSVVQTNQNVYFHSAGPAGIYSTGSIATLFNVLATNEISILIRPDIRAIDQLASSGICSTEFDRKLWYSVPYGDTVNNRIMIWDLEKENWNPYALDFGVQQFVRYTDNDGILHLLAIPTEPTAGNFIIEISQNQFDDNGTPFESHIQTGLIHVSPDHVQFAHVQYVYYEFGSPQGYLTVAFSGTPKNLPLSTLASYVVQEGDTLSTVGFSSYAFSAEPYSFDSLPPLTFGALSVKERIRINKLLNNWEGDVSSFAVNTSWTLNQMVVVGQYVPTADPSSWIVN